MRFLYGLSVATCISAQSVAAWEHPLVLEKLQQMDAQAPQPPVEQLKSSILSAAQAYAGAKDLCVPSDITMGEVAPITGAGVILQAVMSGRLRNGWTAYATLNGCPGETLFRYMMLQKTDGSLVSAFVNEGKTYANPTIMRDTSPQAALAALQKAKNLDSSCTGEPMEMGATRIVAQSDDLGPEIFGVRYVGSWSEIWQFKTCGRIFEVPIEFTPDGDGGAYTNIKADEVAVAP